MAEPMTAAQFLKALRAEGLTVVEVGSWRTHNRNHKGPWGPLHGVMIHHTAGGESGSTEVIRDGYEGLPGPLSQGLIHKNGTVDVVGWGRCNHAGTGDPEVFAAVKAETYPLPPTDVHDGESGVDGNAHFIGYECVNLGNGKDPWPAIQLEAIARAAAAVCRFYGWNVNSVIRHMDWSDWKVDPKGINWTNMRARIEVILAGKPNATPMDGSVPTDPGPPKPPAKPVVSVRSIIAASRRDPGLPQGGTTSAAQVKPVEQALARLGFLNSAWVDGSFGTRTVSAYAAFQRSLGYRGRDADGIPGKASLTALGARSGLFTVIN